MSQRPKNCTEARNSVLKPEHTIGSCRSSPEVRSQRLPCFSSLAIAASPESHILSDSACFIELIIKLLAAGDLLVTCWKPAGHLGKRGCLRSLCSIGALGCMLHTNDLIFNLAKIKQQVNQRLNFKYLLFEQQTIFESWSSLLSHRVAGPPELPKAAAPRLAL